MSRNEARGSYGLRVFLLSLAVSLIMGGSGALGQAQAPRMT